MIKLVCPDCNSTRVNFLTTKYDVDFFVCEECEENFVLNDADWESE